MLTGETGAALPGLPDNLPLAAAGNEGCFLSGFRGVAFSFIRGCTTDSDGGLLYGY
jgi:hypothetical protein